MAAIHVAATVAIRLDINHINPFYLLFLENFVYITNVTIFIRVGQWKFEFQKYQTNFVIFPGGPLQHKTQLPEHKMQKRRHMQ